MRAREHRRRGSRRAGAALWARIVEHFQAKRSTGQQDHSDLTRDDLHREQSNTGRAEPPGGWREREGRQRQVPHLRGRLRRRRSRGARNGGRPSRSPHDRSQGEGDRKREHRRRRGTRKKRRTRAMRACASLRAISMRKFCAQILLFLLAYSVH